MKSNTISFEELKYIDASIRKTIENYTISKHDLYLTIAGTIGAVGIVPDEFDGMNLTENAAKLTHIQIDKKFLMYSLLSTSSQEHFAFRFHQVAQPKLSIATASSTMIPLPPISEQERIVEFLENTVTLVDSIQNYSNVLSQIVQNTKSKILELAMQGKLVPQDHTDESASDMLRRVNPKAKIITDTPHLRNIPNRWCLCELRDLCAFISRGKSPKYSDVPNQYPVFAQKCNLKDGGISLNQARFLDESTLPKWPNKYKLKDQDILVNSTGTGTVGRTRLFLNKYLKEFPFVVPDSHVSVVRTFDEIDSKFIYFNLISREGQTYFNDNLSGSTNQKELYIEAIGNKLIFLPPKNEQERIVAKIEELYSCLDKIEASLQS